MSLLNEQISAQQALDWGLVSEIATPGNDFKILIEKWRKKISKLSPEITIAVRKLMYSGWNHDITDHLEKELTIIKKVGSQDLFSQKITKRLKEIESKS